MDDTLQWLIFGGAVLGMLSLDLGVFHRKPRAISFKESLTWSGIWIATALLFNGYIYFDRGLESAVNFLTGYLVEKSLSVDNLFVFLFMFRAFETPTVSMHKVLFWGVLGAIVSRAVLIALGLEIIVRFSWSIYFFGVFLILGGIRLLLAKEKAPSIPGESFFLWLKQKGWMTEDYHGSKFWIRKAGRVILTPLFAVLFAIEATDLFFSIDSIPAILAITTDPYIVYTSNIFAVLGLRSLYFALSHMNEKFCYLSKGLAIILIFVGLKMFMGKAIGITAPIALAIILTILIFSIAASLFYPLEGKAKKVKPSDQIG